MHSDLEYHIRFEDFAYWSFLSGIVNAGRREIDQRSEANLDSESICEGEYNFMLCYPFSPTKLPYHSPTHKLSNFNPLMHNVYKWPHVVDI